MQSNLVLCSMQGTLVLFLTVGVACSLLGCDSVNRGYQQITLEIQSPTGAPLSGLKAVCAPVSRGNPSTLDDLSTNGYLAQAGMTSSESNANGRAAITQRVVTVNGGIGVWLGVDKLELRDEVTGRPYHFRIVDDEPVTTMTMQAGASCDIGPYRLTVLNIGPPIPTPKNR